MGDAPLVFRILGPIEAARRGRPVDIGPYKQRCLLALLVIAAPRVVSTDRLLDDLWGDAAGGKENALWVYISRLRAVLDPERQGIRGDGVLATRDHGYVLTIPLVSIDAHRFEQLASEGSALVKDDPTRASEMLGSALRLWRGSALQDFTYEDFARPEILRLEELRLVALEHRIDADLRLGRSSELVAEIEALHRDHPLRERFVAQLMLAFYRSGRQADALRAFERFRRHVGAELGTEPSPELIRLEEQILLHDTTIHGPKRPRQHINLSSGNPFKGLHAFGEGDAGDFFGRERLTSEALRRLRDGARLIALVGPSGSGKSSLLKAGILPAIRKGALEGSDGWLVAQMTPGTRPFAELEAALLRASLDAPNTLGPQLADPDNGILRAVLRVFPDDSSCLVLAIDQFEELFMLVEDDGVRRRFLSQLVPLLDDARGRIVVIVTLRADYYSRPLDFPEFGARLGDGVINVVPLLPDELEAAALRPAAQAGVHMQASLLAALLSDVIGEPGGLPLFQFTLTELFDRRDGESLTLASYEAMGGVKGAIRKRADDIYAGLGTEEQKVARQLFLRLVTVTSDDGWSRRRVPASEVLSLGVDLGGLQHVIDLYASRRLLTLDREPLSGSPCVEVAHEALLTEWPRLRDWILEAKDDLRMRGSLTATIEEWDREGRDPGYLLTSTRLDRYEAWSELTSIQLTQREREFVRVSALARKEAVDADAERHRREASLQRSASFRLWGLLALVVIGLAFVGLSLTGFFRPDIPNVGFIYQGSGDRGLNDLAIQGFEEAQRRYEMETAVVTPLTDPKEDLNRLCDSQFDAVIVLSAFYLSVGGGGPQCGDTLVVGVDWPPPDVVPLADQPNVVQAIIPPGQGGYLAGAAAALTSQTGVVGFVGGLPIPPVDIERAAYEQAARAVDPKVRVESIYLSVDSEPEGFFDPDRARVATQGLIAAGADVIYHNTGDSGAGVLQAVREASEETGFKHWFIGSEADDYLAVSDTDRQYVLTSVVKRDDRVILDVIDKFISGSLRPGPRLYGLAGGAIELSTSGGFLDDHIGRLSTIKDKIISGEIAIRTEPEHSATLSPP